MRKTVLLFIVAFMLVFTSCNAFCEHKWENATCYTPKTCANCGKTEGGRLEHSFTKPTCAQNQTCTLCNAIGDAALEHTLVDADCESPKHCTACNYTEGDPLGHTFTEEIITQATSYENGTKRIKCEKCDYSAEEEFFAQKLTARQLYKMALDRCCEINVTLKPDAEYSAVQGSGFLISADGLIVTNYHVIEDYVSITVTIDGNTHLATKVIDYDEEIDLAVIKINIKDAPFFTLAEDGFAEGDVVYAFGSPIGFDSSITMGIISNADRDDSGRRCIQHDASITHGNSGGPLINEFGQVIGVNTFIYTNSQNLNFAVAISELSNLSLTEEDNTEEPEEPEETEE